ncbi:MAG: GAF domain-containing protein [Chlorobia bacterium]|nr:GAF domain-containing protein [Fimbriimonadaceae bacterium]
MEPEPKQASTAQERLNLLRSIAGGDIGLESMQPALTRLATEVCKVFGVDFCVIRRLDGENLILLACAGIDESRLERSIKADFAIAKVLIETKQPFGVRDAHAHLESTPNLQAPPSVNFVSYAGTPMINRDEILGTMGIFAATQIRDFSDADLDLLQALGAHIAIAIRNHELYTELNALNSELDERVSQRTSELELANRELEAFTYTIAHDLRTPLRSIVSNAQILLKDFAESLPADAKPLLQRQSTAAKRLSVMMDGLLSLARIGKHDIRPVQMNLSRLAEELALEVIRSSTKPKPEFYIEPDILIAADPSMMKILLQNLFENSIKFVAEGKGTVVRVRTDPVDPTVSFVVEDEGIGFEMEYSPKVFLPFERLVREEEYPGTGIGLASVKRIVDKHRGSVQVKSRPGEGTAFEFRL